MIVNNYYHILKSNHSLIDLRSQFEFEKGSFPNAVNIPILNDYERDKVGKEFNNFGKNSAINLGKKLVSDSKKNKRINMWLDHLTEFPESILFLSLKFFGVISINSSSDMMSKDSSRERICARGKQVMSSVIQLTQRKSQRSVTERRI